MAAFYCVLRVRDDVRQMADVDDESISPLGTAESLRGQLATAFPMAKISSSTPRGWVAVLGGEHDFVLEVETVFTPTDEVGSLTVRVLPDLSPGRKRGSPDLVHSRIRAVAEAVGAVAFDTDARL